MTRLINPILTVQNIAAVKNMVKMSIPLSLGNLMSYGEVSD